MKFLTWVSHGLKRLRPAHNPEHYYEEYERLSKADLSQVEIFRVIKEWCAGRKNVLEVGCGIGYLANYLGASGADMNEEAIRRAKDHYPHLKFYCCGVQDTQLPAHSFDAIICNNIFEHLEDDIREQAYRELQRIATPDAIIIYGYSDPYHPMEILSGFSKFDKGLLDLTHIHNWSVGGFIKELRKYLRVEEARRVSIFAKFLPYSQVFKGAVVVRCAVKTEV